MAIEATYNSMLVWHESKNKLFNFCLNFNICYKKIFNLLKRATHFHMYLLAIQIKPR